jgi:hypothetical protein
MKALFKKVLVYLVFAIAFFCIFLLLSKIFSLGYSWPRILILSILVAVAVFLKDELSKRIFKKKMT